LSVNLTEIEEESFGWIRDGIGDMAWGIGCRPDVGGHNAGR